MEGLRLLKPSLLCRVLIGFILLIIMYGVSLAKVQKPGTELEYKLVSLILKRTRTTKVFHNYGDHSDITI